VKTRFEIFAQFLREHYDASLVRGEGETLHSPELWQSWPSLQAAIDNQSFAICRADRAKYFFAALGLNK
jgi:hypothetical protein